MTSSPPQTFALISKDLDTIDSICIGSGRFLRSVLVPALFYADYHPIIVQTRGRSFLDYALQQQKDYEDYDALQQQNESDDSSYPQSWSYEVDTVNYDGRIKTSDFPFWGAGTLGSVQGKKEILKLLQEKQTFNRYFEKPFLVGVGVTEAGLANANTQAMQDLYAALKALSKNQYGCQRVCVIDMDNIPQNGTLLQKFMNELASKETNDDPEQEPPSKRMRDDSMKDFLEKHVVFHNTMVDRITSQRPSSNGLVPRCEPVPGKALVIEDLDRALDTGMALAGGLIEGLRGKRNHGVVVRRNRNELDVDIALKLRVANGTHTAAAHAMALLGLVTTDVLSSSTSSTSALLMKYLDSFFERQILPAGCRRFRDTEEIAKDIRYVYDDWRRRLIHAHFGLSTFFITQNGAAKGGIRIGPTIRDLIETTNQKKDCPIDCSTAFALAALLRFLTGSSASGENGKSLFRGTLDPKHGKSDDDSGTITYADGLSYDLKEGWYTFRCDCEVTIDGTPTLLPTALSNIGANQQPVAYGGVIRDYLCQPKGGNLSAISKNVFFGTLVEAISTLYARMVSGDSLLDILQSLDLEASCESLVDGE